MNDKQKKAIDALNEMFWCQNRDFRENWRCNYFVILDYIVQTGKVEISYDEIRRMSELVRKGPSV